MRDRSNEKKPSATTVSARRQPRFDRTRFKTLVHYVCWTCEEPRRLSMRRLNRVLWYTDRNEHFFTGTPLTGATYYRQNTGPATRALPPVLTELQRDGVLAQRENGDGAPGQQFFALKKPLLHLFTSEQISNVETVARNVMFDVPTAIPNQAAHDRVHDVAQIGESFPYFTVLAGRPAEILRRDLAWAMRKADLADVRASPEGSGAADERSGDAVEALIWYLNRDPSAGISLPNADQSWFLYKQAGAPAIGVPDVLVLYRFDLEELVTGAIRVDASDPDAGERDDD